MGMFILRGIKVAPNTYRDEKHYRQLTDMRNYLWNLLCIEAFARI